MIDVRSNGHIWRVWQEERYCEALREARRLRRRTVNRWARRDGKVHHAGWMTRAWPSERQRGAPEGWYGR